MSSDQQSFDFKGTVAHQQATAAVTCLGQTFANDAERRAYFTALLRKKLQDPAFHQIEGFPHGTDEDILALSDPPYYTACPNPWIADFIVEWEAQKPAPAEGEHYHREPFAADVSEGKNDPIYNAHSYHTKVPHKAIMRYILHYTQPGDIVFDGFCGTGMTGVAAQMCGDREQVLSLGYRVNPDGTILQEEVDENGKKGWKAFSKLGVRRAVLSDLSPAATFIAYNYNTPVDVEAFEREAKRILAEVEAECGWMYETLHTDRKTKGKINYTVWSDVFVCPECASEVIFWESAVNVDEGKVEDEFPCPHCTASLTKRNMERAWTTSYDSAIKETIRQAKQVPVLINYTANGKRHEKKPDDFDRSLIENINSTEIPYWFPADRMMEGQETRRNDPIGITHTHHFYTRRNLCVMSSLYAKSKNEDAHLFELVINMMTRANKQSSLHISNFFNGGGGVCKGHLTGTLYVPSLSPEIPALKVYDDRIKTLLRGYRKQTGNDKNIILSTQSLNHFFTNDSFIDFIFIDPPFGANLNYSELNWNDESWLKVVTNNKEEAIENSVQGKGLHEYRQLMTASFSEAYRMLKPGRWMTVEFSNTKSSVWNSIQTALTEAGFIVANVSALDKKQGSFKAVTTPTAVKQDLVISAYKPNGGFEARFEKEAQTEEGVWDFVRTHLKYLPVSKRQGALLQLIPERDPRILFDQMVAYYVRKGYPVPISSPEFQQGLAQRFIDRDGMYFLPEQAAEYDRVKMTSEQVVQASLFVSDEATAIQWLRQLLKNKPQTFADINPQFMQQLGGWSKNEAQLDLRELLNQNFLSYDGKGDVPEQIHAYLSTNWKELRNLPKTDPTLVSKAKDRWYVPDPNKSGDLEKLRERALLKEFEEYKQAKKKLKVFRLEAVRAGFKKAWQERDYTIIVKVAEVIPSNVLEEDPKLLMWYDQAVTRMGG
jgi:DNA modification methylase/predicted RNA-binding Zn-ribbon protein involved in translation (DUF1610 family)